MVNDFLVALILTKLQYELNCGKCHGARHNTDCQKCIFTQLPAATDKFYYDAVLPFTYIAAAFLFIAYCIGLLFTLRTHAASIWQAHADTIPQQLQNAFLLGSMAQRREGHGGYETESLRHPSYIKDPKLYQKMLGQSLSGVGMRTDGAVPSPVTASTAHPGQSLHLVPPRSAGEGPVNTTAPNPVSTGLREPVVNIPGLSSEQNARLVRGVAEVAAAAATAAVQDAQRQQEQHQRQQEQQRNAVRKLHAAAVDQGPNAHNAPAHLPLAPASHAVDVVEETAVHSGHDAPNWGRSKSAVILLGSTILYAIIAGE